MVFKGFFQSNLRFSLPTDSPEKGEIQICAQGLDRRKIGSLLCTCCYRGGCSGFLQEIHGNAGIGKGLLGVRNRLRSNFLGDGKDTRFDGPAEAVSCIQQEQVKSSWIPRWPHRETVTIPPPTTLEIASLNEESSLSLSSEGHWTGRPSFINTPPRPKTQAAERALPGAAQSNFTAYGCDVNSLIGTCTRTRSRPVSLGKCADEI